MAHISESVGSGLDWKEWHFDDILPQQKLDCLYYETARESASFRSEVNALRGVNPAEAGKRIRSRRSHFTTQLDFIDFYFRFRSVIHLFPDQPWLAIPEECRNRFSSDEGLVCGNEGSFANAAFWNFKEGEIIDSEMSLELDPGYLPIEALINWNYSNAVIISQFGEWVEKESKRRAEELPAERFAKPSIIANQKGRGLRYTDSQLKQIAIIRLLHHMPFKRALALVVERRSQIPHGSTCESHWYSQRKESKMLIQKYLAFRPKTELPLNFETFSSARKKTG